MSRPGYIQPMPLPDHLNGIVVHLVGAKGTGMCAMAELLVSRGAAVSGSDISEEFYTDAILAEIGVKVGPFSPSSLDSSVSLVIRSAAYDESNPVVAEANKRGLPILTYPEALGELSSRYDSSAIAGVHGKTTTTAMAGTILMALNAPATVVAGSAVSGFGDRSTWIGGDRFLVAETCEYRRHFLHYNPSRIVLTSIEPDHQDYYPDLDSIMAAFREFLLALPEGGEVIYCRDDDGASKAVESVCLIRPDIVATPYGALADGPWKVKFGKASGGKNRFRVDAFDVDFHLVVPGRHLVLDAVAAMALAASLLGIRNTDVPAGFDADTVRAALAGFRGSRRRSEIIGEAGDVLVMDDYGHHPTAIAVTLKGIREFHPERRLVVDFMPHTYSRTAALFEDFAGCFDDADLLLLHPIYASAREVNSGGVTGLQLFERSKELRKTKPTYYCDTLDDAVKTLRSILRPGDLFLTLGAGNNRSLGPDILKEFSR
jgi:UDP-N-acetylmuramate--alanine ligase